MQTDASLSILQISTRDIRGGAERVAWDLFRTYRESGHASALGVGYKHSHDPDVFCLPNEAAAPWPANTAWRWFRKLQPHYPRSRSVRWACKLCHGLAAPRSVIDRHRGLEDFHYPGTHLAPDQLPRRPDVIHCHNLHGYYFDLRVLPQWSKQWPVVLTLHDTWLLAGHCAYFLDCRRWKTGCGQCPDLTLYPSVKRDATDRNWQRKREIFHQSRLHIATPCRWLMNQVEQSILAPAMVEGRVIPYGVDLAVFHPADQATARKKLGIPPSAKVVLFVAAGILNNPWKDYATIRKAIACLAQRKGHDSDAAQRPPRLIFLAVGDDAPPQRIGDIEIRFIPFVRDPVQVARFYQAADLFVHAARADTFPCTILEALACGLPVVATAVGGIPEQVDSLANIGPCPANVTTHSADDATGLLVEPSNAQALAAAVAALLDHDDRRRCLGTNAARVARRRFDLSRQAEDYLSWYKQLAAPRQSHGTIEPEGAELPKHPAPSLMMS